MNKEWGDCIHKAIVGWFLSRGNKKRLAGRAVFCFNFKIILSLFLRHPLFLFPLRLLWFLFPQHFLRFQLWQEINPPYYFLHYPFLLRVFLLIPRDS